MSHFTQHGDLALWRSCIRDYINPQHNPFNHEHLCTHLCLFWTRKSKSLLQKCLYSGLSIKLLKMYHCQRRGSLIMRTWHFICPINHFARERWLTLLEKPGHICGKFKTRRYHMTLIRPIELTGKWFHLSKCNRGRRTPDQQPITN